MGRKPTSFVLYRTIFNETIFIGMFFDLENMVTIPILRYFQYSFCIEEQVPLLVSRYIFQNISIVQ